MKIAPGLHIVGSGKSGFNLTDDYDCHVYLLDGGSECALIDAGGGRDPEAILRLIQDDGIDPRRVTHLLLTHAHADHAAGAAGLRARLGVRVVASPEVGQIVAAGDARAASLEAAKRAGGYPPDVDYPACPVETTLRDGATMRVGELEIEAIATPGHAVGHLSYVLRRDGKTSLFCGDAFFFGGRILLQDTWDCSVQDSVRTVERLHALSTDGLYPGHLTFAVNNGHREVAKAMEYVARLVPPPQLFS
jgi:hydroxyacylglutathione hydrolase